MNILLFEDNFYNNFGPLTKLRPIHELRTGIYSISDKYQKLFSEDEFYFYHRAKFNTRYRAKGLKLFSSMEDGEEFIAINSRILPDNNLIKYIDLLKSGKSKYIKNKDNNLLVGMFKTKKEFKTNYTKKTSNSIVPKFNIISYPWDLITSNGNQIISDLKYIKAEKGWMRKDPEHVILTSSENIYIKRNANIRAGVIIDASDGPVIIDEKADIMQNSVIIGPAYIGKGSTVKIGAKIYENTSIGEVCKVGGEIEGSIIHGYSNKQHDGFLGHAYLAEWCNLGADTNNSDLKNNYSNVKVELNGNLIDTGSMFVGLIMGDHSKTGINTMFNTGTVVGIGCNVYGAGFPPRNIPDFHWGSKEKLVRYPFKRTLATMITVMARRNKELSKKDKEILEKIHLKSK
ncbi:MAG: putative sugar nucleotidyl transferase [Candidatus Delongbacteria bacterium]|jgi:UDP-N-acetylglucosamine diphosphorylase/glucosamine-1-phosphate N-acetyltransferase|nr:putative sugar nucleotidyl transferase [Candidatus Delongbacteria bacterium]